MDIVITRSEEARNILFETISVYFANTFWVKLHKISEIQFKDKKYDSLLDAYKANAERYSRSFTREENPNEKINSYYLDIIIHLTSYFCEQIAALNKTKVINISEKDFADIFAIHVFPEEEYRSMGRYDEHKSVVMRKILTRTVSTFSMYFITEVCSLASIASNRTANVEHKLFEQVKNKFKEIITNERNDMYNFFIAARSGIDISRPHLESIPKLIEDRMTNEIKALIEENSQLIEVNNKSAKLIKELKKIIKSLQKRIESLEAGLNSVVKNAAPPSRTAHKDHKEHKSHKKHATQDSDIKFATVMEPIETTKHTKALEKLSFSGDDFVKEPDELESAGSGGLDNSGGLENSGENDDDEPKGSKSSQSESFGAPDSDE